jgi:hypothetical protein
LKAEDVPGENGGSVSTEEGVLSDVETELRRGVVVDVVVVVVVRVVETAKSHTQISNFSKEIHEHDAYFESDVYWFPSH